LGRYGFGFAVVYWIEVVEIQGLGQPRYMYYYGGVAWVAWVAWVALHNSAKECTVIFSLH
jgi:hypothetical protein